MSLYYVKPTVDVVLYPEQNKLPARSLDLTPHQSIKAEVVDILPSGRVIVRVGGIYVNMRTEIPLTKGTLLHLIVLPPSNNNEEKALKLKLLSFEVPQKTLKDLISKVNKEALLLELIKLPQKEDILEFMIQKGMLPTKKSFQHLMALLSQDKQESMQDLQKLQQLVERIDIDDPKSFKSLKQIFDTIVAKNPSFQPLKEAMEHYNKTGDKSILSKNLAQLVENEQITPEQIKKFVQGSGLFFEKHLQALGSLKELQQLVEKMDINDQSSFQELKRVFESIVSKNQVLHRLNVAMQYFMQTKKKDLLYEKIEELTKELKEAIKNDPKAHLKEAASLVTQYQFMSALIDGIYTYLPFVWDELEDATLAITRKKEGYLFQLLLNFEDIGEVGAHAFLHENDLKVVLFSEDKEFGSFLASSFDTLRAELQKDFGYLFVSLGDKLSVEKFVKKDLVDIEV